MHEVVDEPDGEGAGCQAHALVGVAVDDVVAPGVALDLAGLATTLVVPGLLLEAEGDVLAHVAEPRALVHPLDEATLDAARAGVVLEAGEEPRRDGR